MTELDIKKAFSLIKKHFPKQILKDKFQFESNGLVGTCIIQINKEKNICLFLNYDFTNAPTTIQLDSLYGMPSVKVQQFIFFPSSIRDIKSILNSLKI